MVKSEIDTCYPQNYWKDIANGARCTKWEKVWFVSVCVGYGCDSGDNLVSSSLPYPHFNFCSNIDLMNLFAFLSRFDLSVITAVMAGQMMALGASKNVLPNQPPPLNVDMQCAHLTHQRVWMAF